MMGWHCPFRIGTLTSRRRSPRIGSSYPIPEFGLLAESARTCVEKTRSDDMVDQTVVGAVNGVVDELTVEKTNTRRSALRGRQILECLVFLGYGPSLDGDEPPGL